MRQLILYHFLYIERMLWVNLISAFRKPKHIFLIQKKYILATALIILIGIYIYIHFYFSLSYTQPKIDAVTYVGTQLYLEGQSMPVRPRPLSMMDPDGSHHYENTVTLVGKGTVPVPISFSQAKSVP